MNPVKSFLFAFWMSVKTAFSWVGTQTVQYFPAHMKQVKFMCGSVATVIGELIGGIVMMFVGLFMVDAVFNAVAINNTSVFYGVSSWLVTWCGTIFSILGLVITVIALGTAFRSIMGFAQSGG